jgi:Rod binding domain-containing protein
MGPIDPALIPPGVRNAGPQAVKLYGAALQFESLLTSQITQQMFDASQSLGGDDDQAQQDGAYQSMLPGALTDTITQDGGLGLATSLYQSFGGVMVPTPARPATDGAS